MGSQALPNYTVPVPQTESPFQSVGQLMQLQNGMAELAVRHAQAEQERQNAERLKAETEQRNRDLTDQNTIQEALKNPELSSKIMGGDFTPIQGKVQPKTQQALETWHANHQKELLINTADQNAAAATNLSKIEDTILGLKSLGDPDKIAEAYPQALAALRGQKAFEYLPKAEIPESFNGDPKQLDQMLAGIGGLRAATDKALATQKTKGEISGKAAETAKANAETANLQAQNPGIAAEAAGKVANLPVTQATAASTLANPNLLNPEQQQQAKQAAATEAETALHNRTEESLSRSKDVREQHIYEQTYGEGANQALIGVEPKLRTAATSAAQKAANEYQDAQRAADDIKTFVDSARKGNKVAYSYLPTEGVLTLNTGRGIKRVNMAEISSYGGAGSALDRVQGFLGKQLTGASIPADVLKDIENIHASIQQNAVKGYNDKLTGINQNYHANFKPVPGSEVKAAGDIPTPGSQAEFNALPKGAQFKKPNDPQVYIKQ